MIVKAQLGAVLAFLPFTIAHYHYPIFVKNGVLSKVWEFVRRPAVWPADRIDDPSYVLAPLYDPWSTDIRCGQQALKPAPDTQTAKVTASDEIGFHLFPGKTVYHPGPTTISMSRAPGNVSEYDGSGDWVKVHDLGVSINPNPRDKYDRVLWHSINQEQFTFKLPTTTPPGQYLLRIESAQVSHSFNATQRFVQCAQIDVEGPGGGTPQPTTKIPSPEMMFDRGQWVSSNLYFPERASDEDILSYQTPYGPVWTG